MMSLKGKTFRIIVEILLCISIVFCVIAANTGVLLIPEARVHCNDPSIRNPYLNDTISAGALFGVTFAIPIVMTTIIEWVFPPSAKAGGGNNRSPLRRAMYQSFLYYLQFSMGVLATLYVSEIFKVAVSEPRPHFWDACAPNVTEEQCKQPYVSVSTSDCTNPHNLHKMRIINSMKSFPSGHAAISVFTSFVMIVYIKQRLWKKWSTLIALWLQICWVTWAIVCCQSRIWDNAHHWWDVLAGGLLGVIAGWLQVCYINNWFVRENDLKKSQVTVTIGEESEDTGYHV